VPALVTVGVDKQGDGEVNKSTRTTPVVLVADDEPSMLALVARHVRTLGYSVLEASDGEAAWREAESSLPDLVVLDVMMPGMSGWEVCRRIRESISLHHTGVIMLTGIGQSLNELTSPLYGADAYIDKPFEFRDLDRKISQVLTERGHEPPVVEQPSLFGSHTSEQEDHSNSDDFEDDTDGEESDRAPIEEHGASETRAYDPSMNESAHSWGGQHHASAQKFDHGEPVAAETHFDKTLYASHQPLSVDVIDDNEEDEFSMAVTLRPPPPASSSNHGAWGVDPPAAIETLEEDEEEEPITQRPGPRPSSSEPSTATEMQKASREEKPNNAIPKKSANKAAKIGKTKKVAESKPATKKASDMAPGKDATKKSSKRAACKRATTKEAPAKKATTKKATTKKAPAKKAPAKKAPAKKVANPKTTTKAASKTVAKKTAPKKSTKKASTKKSSSR